MSDELKPPEQMTDEELEALIVALSEQMRVIGAEMQPYAQEHTRRKCEANPYLKLLREGAVIEVEWEDDIGVTYYVNGEVIPHDPDLSKLEYCPQVDEEAVYEEAWRRRYRLVLAKKGEADE